MPGNYKYNLKVSQRKKASPYTVDLFGVKEGLKPERIKKVKKKAKRREKGLYKKRILGFFGEMKASLRKLFIVAFILFIAGLIYKILKAVYIFCDKIGWITAYVARLFYFTFKALLVLLLKIFLPFIIIYTKYKNNKYQPEGITLSGMTVEYGNPEIVGRPLFGGLKTISFKEIFSLNRAVSAVKETSKKALPKPRKTFIRPALFFSGFLFIAILPFKGVSLYNELDTLKGKVLGVSEAAVSEMAMGAEAANKFDFTMAGKSFERAGSNFISAQKEIEEVSHILSVLSLIPSKSIKAASDAADILEAGKLSAELGVHLSAVMDGVAAEDKSIEKIVNGFYFHGQAMNDIALRLEMVVSRIDPGNLPDEHGAKFEALAEKSVLLLGSLKELVDMVEKIRIFLGFENDKRYLLVFQNNAEIRGGGGFAGSYALVDFSGGKIKNLEVPAGGSYDTEGGLIEKIISPKPLWILNPRWFFWDANWWPDWTKSAEKLSWFYEKSGGPTIDGVIGVTPNIIEDVLGIVGSIEMNEYGTQINSENFRDITQALSELKPLAQDEIIGLNEKIEASDAVAENIPEEELEKYKEEWTENNKPKKIIGDLLGRLMEEVPKRLDKNVFLSLLGAVSDNIREKQILFYFKDEVLKEKAAQLDWDGRMKESLQDYLMVVHSNIGGHKSDLKIEDEIIHSIDIGSDGTVIDTVKIIRRHTAPKGELFTGENNVDWLRVYVPQGAKLLDAGGFTFPPKGAYKYPESDWKKDPDIHASEQSERSHESGALIFNELGKTVFAGWVQTKPETVSEAYFKYELPFKVKSEEAKEGISGLISDLFNFGQKPLMPYSILIQKQPGSKGALLTSDLRVYGGQKINWSYPDSLSATSNAWQYKGVAEKDIFFAAVMED
jgi:hypothetical protein